MKLLLVVATSLLLVFIPISAANAQASGSSHHVQHIDVAACSAACSTSSTRVDDRSQRNVTAESTTREKREDSVDYEDAEETNVRRHTETLQSFEPDESSTYKAVASYLL